MPADEILLDSEVRMEKAVEVFKHSMTGIRTGRANPGLVDSLRVEVYGAPAPIKSVAQVGAPEPTQIVIRPFDPGTIKDIEKRASYSSDLGLQSAERRVAQFGSTFRRCRPRCAASWSAASRT